MNFRKVNNIAGWIVCAMASLVYILTAEKRGSFWDCGEFVSACYKVQLPQPPGAPLFVLLGRFFIILFGNDPLGAAKAVNIMNALASGFTILFLFWTITHFARKLMTGFRQEPDGSQTATIMGAGLVGAMAYTFSDSFWFSAVEGEVYALSSLFTALAFWAILKWERADDAAGTDRNLRNRADRWIVFLFFSLGLSIGVHLLGLLVIPAAVMVYYFKRYNYTRKGSIWAFLLGCTITGIVQVVVIQWSVKIAGRFDIFFVNSFHLPFFSGFVFFFVLLAVLIWLGLRWANKNNWSYLRLGLWCFAFMMLGYSTYVTTMERSNANPSLDMNNVDNPMSLVYYLGREQYGSQPIVMGPHFVAQYERDEQGNVVFSEGKMNYAKGDDRYIELGRESEPKYKSRDIQLFPRVWDPTNEQGHADFYMQWLNLGVVSAKELSQVRDVDEDNNVIYTIDQTGKQDQYPLPDNYRPKVLPGQVVQAGAPIAVEAPSYLDNMRWFFTYQMGFMYWRYFMWNFAGRQNDLQGFGNRRDGNWITGISIIDNARLGDQSKMPASIRDNKAKNTLFLIPFILGVIGCIYHFLRDRRDWVVTFLLFFFTGLAIVVYLNQPGGQPRERDYAFAGSFYAYAIWIGLSVVALVRMAREREDKATFTTTLVYGALTTLIVQLLSDANNFNGSSILAALISAIIYGIVLAAFTYAVRAIAGKTGGLRMAALVSTVLCLSAPVIMGAQEWNDHDRSIKLLAPDIARVYLESCAQNAILFTFGDNDTYPLWYAQEVEGVRPDIRIINTSLLGIDWYVNQLRYKVNESAPIDVIWSADQVRGLQYIRNSGSTANDSQPLYEFMKNKVGPMLNAETKSDLRIAFPAHLTVPVDQAFVRSSGLVNPTDTILPEVTLDISPNKSYFSLDQLTMMNVLASTNWRRPICFTSPYGETGFGPYLKQVGLVFQLVPTRVEGRREVDVSKTYGLLMDKFRSGNANVNGVYFDEENRRQLLSIRQTYALTASTLVDQGKKAEALNVLNKSESLIKPESLPYAMVSSRGNFHNQISMLYLEAAYKAGDKALSDKLKTALRKDLKDQKNYYDYLKNNREEFYGSFASDEEDCDRFLQILDQWEKIYNGPVPATIVPEIPGHRRDTLDSARNK